MMSYRKKMFFVVLLVFSVIFAGCSKKHDDIRPTFAKQKYLAIVHSPRYPIEAKKLAQEALDNWANGRLDPRPILIDAVYREMPNGEYLLTLYMSDEEFNVKGFNIRETCLHADGTIDTLEENYPLFVKYAAGIRENIRFSERQNIAIRKSETEWTKYTKEGRYASEENYPTVYCSIPCSPEKSVKILIYDESGNHSSPCLLRSLTENEKEGGQKAQGEQKGEL